MKKIAIIDDQPNARDLVASVLGDAISNLNLESEWGLYVSAPFERMEEYPAVMEQENIGILLLDERLGEIPDASGKTVTYKGSDLVQSLRALYKELPIYGVTAHPDDSSLQEYFSLFDEVIKREDFTEKASSYLERFLRKYQGFLEANEEELAELSQISSKIALGQASDAEKARADAIQQNLEIPLTARYIGNRQEWLEEYSKVIAEYKEIQDKAQSFLDNLPPTEG